MKKAILTTIFAALLCAAAAGQPFDLRTGYDGALMRTEFISYDVREQAEKGAAEQNRYLMPLELRDQGGSLSAQAQISAAWLDRQLFLQVEGMEGYEVEVNGRVAGHGGGSHTPLQFDISALAVDGVNTIALTPHGQTDGRLEQTLTGPAPQPRAFIFSQPKIRIEDFRVTFRPDSTGRHGLLDVQIIMANSYNYAETVTVGYDIYSPAGKLLHYDFREVALEGSSRGEVRFTETVWRVGDDYWSAANPKLHYGQLNVKRGSRMVEYIPYGVGCRSVELADGRIVLNGAPVEIKARGYNAAATEKETERQVAEIKKGGVNTLCPDYPQPMWFYGVCDRLGMYVVDRADINASPEGGDRRVGGAVANDPQWLGAFEARTVAASQRTKNRTCVIARSLGGDSGNGFNMYRCYELLKRIEPGMAAVYDGAGGEWNSDLPPMLNR